MREAVAEIAITGGEMLPDGRGQASFIWPDQLGPLRIGLGVKYILSQGDSVAKMRTALSEIAAGSCCQTPGCCEDDPMCDAMIARAALTEGQS